MTDATASIALFALTALLAASPQPAAAPAPTPAPVVHLIPYGAPTLPQHDGELDHVTLECDQSSTVDFHLTALFASGPFSFVAQQEMLVTVDSPAFTSFDHPVSLADWGAYYGLTSTAPAEGHVAEWHLSELTGGTFIPVGGWHAGAFEGTGSVPLNWSVDKDFGYRMLAGSVTRPPRQFSSPSDVVLRVTYYPAP